MKEEISLRDLLDTEFTINDKMEMVGTFTLDRINMISDILTNLQQENERLNNIINLIKNNIDITIQIIKEQPTENDEFDKWILERLNGIKNIRELKEGK